MSSAKQTKLILFFASLVWLTIVLIWKGPSTYDPELAELYHTHNCGSDRYKAFIDSKWEGKQPYDVLNKTMLGEEYRVQKTNAGAASFFWAPQDTKQKELLEHQEILQEMAVRALDPDLCELTRKDGIGFECPTVWRELAEEDEKELLVVDVGAAHGYWGLIGAGYGYRTIFTEPQPHCNLYLQTAITMSGFDSRSAVYQTMIGNRTELTATVEERNGCLASWPYVSEADKKLAQNVYGGLTAGGFTTVGTKRLDELVSASKSQILLLNIQTETAPFDVLESASQLLKAKAIKVILLRMSKWGWLQYEDKKGDETPRASVKRMRDILHYATSHGYKFKCHVSRAHLGGTGMSKQEIDSLLDEVYERNRWGYTNCILYV
eukprot:TRINITY_DN1264_c0_g1_i1.p1 TRINITY_DN1264_c0_g1~~TRINITY_DN1264_c0_g1_i1.p1  ORF type:complete len:378 (+),score=46.36 TRINITY_DN1264_c0_g1_i1:86-1219(+)